MSHQLFGKRKKKKKFGLMGKWMVEVAFLEEVEEALALWWSMGVEVKDWRKGKLE